MEINVYLEDVPIQLELAQFNSFDFLDQHISPVQVPVLKLQRLLCHCQCVSNLE